MHDFPPLVHAYSAEQGTTPERGEIFAHPDLRGPKRFLLWLLGQQWQVIAVACLVSVLEWLPGSVGPYVIGRIIDSGIRAGDAGLTVRLLLVLLGLVLLGVGAGVLYHAMVVRSWLIGMYGPMKLVTRKSTQLGSVLSRRSPTGEVLSVSASDADEFGGLTQIVSEAVGALIATLVIAGLVLRTSVPLGLLVLVAAPLIVLLVVPLFRPL